VVLVYISNHYAGPVHSLIIDLEKYKEMEGPFICPSLVYSIIYSSYHLFNDTRFTV
jgi:hypothetical protein